MYLQKELTTVCYNAKENMIIVLDKIQGIIITTTDHVKYLEKDLESFNPITKDDFFNELKEYPDSYRKDIVLAIKDML